MTKWFPTRKWWANLIGALTPVVVSWATTGWDVTETVAIITIVSGSIVAYLVPNTGGDSE